MSRTDAAVTLSTIGVEALDDPAADPRLVTRMLGDIARSNRWLGGTHAARFGMAALLDPADRGHTLTLLDVGTGAGDLPLDLQRWAARRDITLRSLGVERIPAAARLATASGVITALACAGALPFRDDSVDIVLMSQLVHHLDAASATRLFAAASRIARRGVVVADLRRASFAAIGFRVAGPLLGMHRVTVHDGVTSLRRSYDPAVLAQLIRAAGVRDAQVRRRPLARVVAWWRTDR